MGIKNLSAFLRNNNCYILFTTEQKENISELLKDVSCICFDINTMLHRICNKCEEFDNEDALVNYTKNRLNDSIVNTLITIFYFLNHDEKINVLLAMDGCSPLGKRPEQQRRRLKKMNQEKCEQETCCEKINFKKQLNFFLTAGSSFMRQITQNFVQDVQEKLMDNRVTFFLNDDLNANEGEIKCLKFLKINNHKKSLIVTIDNDVIGSSLLLSSFHNIIIMSNSFYKQTSCTLLLSSSLISKTLYPQLPSYMMPWLGVSLFVVFGGDYLPAFLAGSTEKQISHVFTNMYSLAKKLQEKNPYDDLQYTCEIILYILEKLSVHRKPQKNNLTTLLSDCNKLHLIIEWFLADCLWVVTYYACNLSPIKLNRTGFIIEDENEIVLFKSLPNSFFCSEVLKKKVNFSNVIKSALNGNTSNQNWENISELRKQILP